MSSCANLIIGGKCVNEFNRATVLTISDAFIRSMKVILKGGFFRPWTFVAIGGGKDNLYR